MKKTDGRSSFFAPFCIRKLTNKSVLYQKRITNETICIINGWLVGRAYDKINPKINKKWTDNVLEKEKV